jgi:hypothetical protein
MDANCLLIRADGSDQLSVRTRIRVSVDDGEEIVSRQFFVTGPHEEVVTGRGRSRLLRKRRQASGG